MTLPEFTLAECIQWSANPFINPKTGRAISQTSKNGVYSKLEAACKAMLANTGRANSIKTQSISKVSLVAKTPPSRVEDMEVHHKYCRCLMHVRSRESKYNPYAICTSKVLHKYDTYRPKYCVYHFKTFTDAELKAYAREKKKHLMTKHQFDESGESFDRKKWIKVLEAYQKEEMAAFTKQDRKPLGKEWFTSDVKH